MVVTNTFFSPDNRRLTSTEFNQFASFGNADNANEQRSSVLNFFKHVPASDTLEQNQRALDCLIKLFIQGVILEAFISQYFPPICPEKPHDTIVEYTIDDLLKRVLRPSTMLNTINELVEKMQIALRNLSNKVRQGEGVYKDDLSMSRSARQSYIDACDKFIDAMHEHFNNVPNFLVNLRDEDLVTEDIIFRFMQFLRTEYEFGRSWVRRFFEYRSLKTARMLLNYYTSEEDQHGMGIQTINDDQERYIEISLPSRLLICDIERLALSFFHEYISHLSASIYPRPVRDREQMRQVIKSYEDIPRQLDEGWMVHTAQIFFNDRQDELLGRARQHLQQRIHSDVNEWVTDMFHPYRAKNYIQQAAFGSHVANEFLRFLRYQVCDGDQIKAYNLYYRISFDLITHYPLPPKWHLSFITTLLHWLLNRPDDLANEAKAARIKTMNGDYIDVETLWESIKHDQPKPDLDSENNGT